MSKLRERVVLDETTRSVSKGTLCTHEEGRTRQEHAGAADINLIMAQAERTGVMPVGLEGGVYADLTHIKDLHSSVEDVRIANESFMSLSARVRNAFENDMVAFTEAFQSEEGVAKLRELGVVAETEETLADRREAAAESRSEKRREARELAKRLELAKLPPV